MPLYLKPPKSGSPAELLSRVLAAVAAAVLLALSFVFGFAIFLVLLVVAAIGALIFSWRFRKVRGQMESMMREAEQSTQYSGANRAQAQNHETEPDITQGETLEGEYEVIDREK